MKRYMSLRGEDWQELHYTGSCSEGKLEVLEETHQIDAVARRSEWSLRLGNRVLRVEHLGGKSYRVNGRELDCTMRTMLEHQFARFQSADDDEAGRGLEAPMPGKIVKYLVAPGDTVKKGQGLVIIEAMKMENELKAQRAAIVGSLCAVEGEGVEKGTLLLEFAEAE